MAFKMKGSPMLRNFGIGASPMKEVTTWEKIKAAAKGVAKGVSVALDSSKHASASYATKVGYRHGKQAREKALEEYDKD